MPIVAGIACEKCGIMYLISKAAGKRIDYTPRRAIPGTFKLQCKVCGAIRLFELSELRPYSVSTDSCNAGYAERGKYILLPEREERIA